MHIHDSAPLSKHLAKPWHRLSRHGRTKALHIIAQSESKNRESRLSLGISACKFPTNSLPQILMVKRSTVAAVASVAGIWSCSSESSSSLKAPASGLFRNVGSCCRCCLKNADCAEPKQSSRAFQEHSASKQTMKAIFALSQIPVDLHSKSFPQAFTALQHFLCHVLLTASFHINYLATQSLQTRLVGGKSYHLPRLQLEKQRFSLVLYKHFCMVHRLSALTCTTFIPDVPHPCTW